MAVAAGLVGALLIVSAMNDSARAEVTGVPEPDPATCGSAGGASTRLAGAGLDTVVGPGIVGDAIVATLCPVAWMNKSIPIAVNAAAPQRPRLKRTSGPRR